MKSIHITNKALIELSKGNGNAAFELAKLDPLLRKDITKNEWIT
jgi:hypothetical protein